MASHETAGGPGAHALEPLQQASSGGFQLAREFQAKTNLKAASQDTTAATKSSLLGTKQPREPELRVNTTWLEPQWQSHDSASPLINAAYPAPASSLGGSPEKGAGAAGSNRSSFSRQNSEEPPLKRQYSDSDSQGSRPGSNKSRRSSLAGSPTKERKGRDWVITTADGAQSVEPDGLHFLLKTCELLDPGMATSRALEAVKEGARASPRNSPRRGASRAPHGRRGALAQSPVRQQHGAAVAAAAHPRERGGSEEAAYFRPRDESEDEYMPDRDEEEAAGAKEDSDDDYEYVPRRAAGRGAAARGSRAAARAAAAAAASGQQQQDQDQAAAQPRGRAAPPAVPVAPAAGAGEEAAVGPLSSASSMRHESQQQPLSSDGAAADSGRAAASAPAQPAVEATTGAAPPAAVAASARGHMSNGPCMNPDCEHPYDSPQWRKGPPNAPVLCNACGTRWLRNGTLKPLVPRRGIRYKNKPRTVSAPPAGKAGAKAAAAAAAAAAARQQAEQAAQQGRALAAAAATAAAPAAVTELAVADLHAGGAAQQHSSLEQQYCQLAGGLIAAEGAAAPDAMAAAAGAVPPGVALLNPALLSALLGARQLGASGQAGFPTAADHMAAVRGAISALQAQQQLLQEQTQQQGELGGTAAAEGAKLGEALQGGGLAKKGSQVFQLQAMAGPHVMAPIYLFQQPQ